MLQVQSELAVIFIQLCLECNIYFHMFSNVRFTFTNIIAFKNASLITSDVEVVLQWSCGGVLRVSPELKRGRLKRENRLGLLSSTCLNWSPVIKKRRNLSPLSYTGYSRAARL